MMEGRKDETFLMVTNWIDYDFLDTYGMTIASGRSFNESFTTDQEACLVNETAIKGFRNYGSLKRPDLCRYEDRRIGLYANNRCCEEF